jgi:arylsulfatase A-like enzyme
MTDQHRPDHIGFGGNPVIQTPHLDALARDGVVFDQAYVANPVCMPNRASVLTGRMPSAHGTRVNGISLDWDAETFVRVLRRNGYRCGHVGKAHFQVMGVLAQEAAALARADVVGEARRASRAPDWDGYELIGRHQREWVEMPPDFYGHDDVHLVVGHGDVAGGHYYQWLHEQDPDVAAQRGWDHSPSRYDGWRQIYQTAVPAELYHTRYVTDHALALLQQYSESADPFYLCVSYPDPHHPFTPPRGYYERYDPRSIPMPETFGDGHERSAPHYREMLRRRGQPQGPVHGWAPTEEQYRAAAAAEYGAITLIDESIGQLLAALDRSGAAENTVVIFTSDHGDMFGDHGVMLKHGMHYQGCIRVPLVFRVPGVAPHRTPALAGSIDLAQTVLDLTGHPEYLGMQGRSLRPVISGEAQSVRECIYIEEDELFSLPGLPGPFRMRTVVNADGRLTIYTGRDHHELFDYRVDAAELDNRYEQTAGRALRTELTELLLHAMAEHADEASPVGYLA